MSLTIFVLDETRTFGRRRSVIDQVLLIRQFAAVGEQLLQFLFTQRLFVSFHLALAFQHDLHRLAVRHLLERIRAESADRESLSFGCVGAAVIPVADSALGIVEPLHALKSEGWGR